jgi:hypothetical protein
MSSGKLAGNIGVAALAAAPIPSTLVGTGLTNCTQAYSATNTLLDLFVGGCTIFILPQIAATQPDQSNPAAPVAGAGAPYTLTRTGTAVTGCKDKNAAVVDLTTCLNAAAYSAYFQFTSDRVIVPAPPPSSVGGIAEQPDIATRPAAAESSSNHSTVFVVGAAAALFAAAAGAMGWRTRRTRSM